MAMFGADVSELRSLASRFESSSEELTRIQTLLSKLVLSSSWTGPDASQFKQAWAEVHVSTLLKAAAILDEGALALRSNATQQEQASTDDSSGVFSGSTSSGQFELLTQLQNAFGSATEGTAFFNETLAALSEYFADGVSALSTAGDVAEFLKGIELPGWFGTLSDLVDIGSIMGDFSDGNWIDGLYDSGALALSVAMPSSPLGWLAGIAKGFVDATLPYNGESQDETLAKGAEILFGEGVTLDSLSPEQASELAQRYDGPWGMANMISDRMDATADKIFPWNW